MQNLLRALGDRRIALKDGKQSQKGFTLVELLVVVIIIGILAGIAIPVFLNQREGAWRAQVETDLKNTSLWAETMATENGGSYVNVTQAELTAAITAGEVRVTEGSTITVQGTPAATGFVLSGTHASLPGTPSPTITYSSIAGGLQNWSDRP